jgi:hypothetical protein
MVKPIGAVFHEYIKVPTHYADDYPSGQYATDWKTIRHTFKVIGHVQECQSWAKPEGRTVEVIEQIDRVEMYGIY